MRYTRPRTYGPAYDAKADGERLQKQHVRIRDLMRDEHWRTLSEIAQVLGYPEASISAQLRHLRKPDFGSYLVDKRRRPNSPGYWEYRVRVVHVGQLEMFGSLQKHNPMRGH